MEDRIVYVGFVYVWCLFLRNRISACIHPKMFEDVRFPVIRCLYNICLIFDLFFFEIVRFKKELQALHL